VRARVYACVRVWERRVWVVEAKGEERVYGQEAYMCDDLCASVGGESRGGMYGMWREQEMWESSGVSGGVCRGMNGGSDRSRISE